MTAIQPGLSLEQLFDPAFLQRVQALSLRVAQAQKGGRLASQRTAARGQGSDFADFKPYVAGDDLRSIDWNIYRRLGKTFVRVFEERQDLPVYLMIDVSHSLFVETPPRFHAAARAALALSAIALGQHDSVALLPFSGEMAPPMRGLSGRAGVVRVAQALAGLAPAGTTALAGALARLAGMKLRRGLVIVMSDFFDDAGLDGVLDALGRLPHRLLLVQMTRVADADPVGLDGDMLIADGERADPVAVTVTPELLARYRDAYRGFAEALTGFAQGRGIGLVRVDADRDVIDQLAPMFAGGGAML